MIIQVKFRHRQSTAYCQPKSRPIETAELCHKSTPNESSYLSFILNSLTTLSHRSNKCNKWISVELNSNIWKSTLETIISVKVQSNNIQLFFKKQKKRQCYRIIIRKDGKYCELILAGGYDTVVSFPLIELIPNINKQADNGICWISNTVVDLGTCLINEESLVDFHRVCMCEWMRLSNLINKI